MSNEWSKPGMVRTTRHEMLRAVAQFLSWYLPIERMSGAELHDATIAFVEGGMAAIAKWQSVAKDEQA